ncbi:MAG: acyl-CoA dehydrogenase family protein [Burkholderiales bacterium]|nr:acyl-CoA dehydrogenase family protein [Burkholderiales bacterium]MDE2503822.1 acyl-CoA dehydrogenase family protein [Burkholderiales bacterium]
MSLLLNDEQTMLRDTAAGFLADRSPLALQRRLRDGGDALRYDAALWREVVDLGWTAAALPEADGGLAAGWKALGAVFEQMGRRLCALPLLSSVVLGTTLLIEAGSADQRAAWLAPLVAGTQRWALALDEGPRHAPQAIACAATRTASGAWRLDGAKVDVIDGVGADAFVVVAHADGRLALFVVPAEAAGVEVAALHRIDSRNAARVMLRGVEVGDEWRLGVAADGVAEQALDQALDRARLCLAAETLGLARAAFEMTIGYLKERVQFDVPIGSFQALQHRAARLYIGLELLESSVAAGFEALDERPAEVAALASLAKARAADLGEQLLNEAVQMHGGIGVTDEFDLGLFLKRARVLGATFGDSLFHRDRYARLQGF